MKTAQLLLLDPREVRSLLRGQAIPLAIPRMRKTILLQVRKPLARIAPRKKRA